MEADGALGYLTKNALHGPKIVRIKCEIVPDSSDLGAICPESLGKSSKKQNNVSPRGFEPSTILYDTVLAPKPPWLPVLDV